MAKIIIGVDLVQAEAVVVAYLVKDEILKKVFKNQEDAHKLMASLMFAKSIKEITKEERFVGKTLRHALNYDAGVSTVQKKLECPRPEAKKYYDLARAGNPKILEYHQQTRELLMENNMTLFGLLGDQCKFRGRWDAETFRAAYAWRPQNCVGRLLNAAWVEFYDKHGDEYELLFQLHDGMYVAIEDKDVEIERLVGILRKCMLRPVDVSGEEMLINVDFSIGKNWGEMKELKGV